MKPRKDQTGDPRPPDDRLAFAFMSYNAGLGNVVDVFQVKARQAGADPNRFATIAPFAWPEPRQYVERIARWAARFGAHFAPTGL